MRKDLIRDVHKYMVGAIERNEWEPMRQYCIARGMKDIPMDMKKFKIAIYTAALQSKGLSQRIKDIANIKLNVMGYLMMQDVNSGKAINQDVINPSDPSEKK